MYVKLSNMCRQAQYHIFGANRVLLVTTPVLFVTNPVKIFENLVMFWRRKNLAVFFIPVTFELTVLISALGMVGVFMVASDLKPYKKLKLMDLRITDDKHVIAIDLGANNGASEEIKKLLKETGAEEVNEKNFE